MRFVENVSASAAGSGVVGVGVGNSHIGPAMAGVAAVKHLRLVRLGHGNPAVPSDLGCISTEPHDLKAEHVAKLGHCLLHVEISEAGTDHVPHFATRLPPAACRRCGADLAGAPVTAQRRHQVTDIVPVPSPKITEYVAQAKECAGCGTVSAGELPAHVRGAGQLRAGDLVRAG